MLVADNIRLNVAIDKLHNSTDTIELNSHLNHDFHQPWSKIVCLRLKIHTPDKDLQCEDCEI